MSYHGEAHPIGGSSRQMDFPAVNPCYGCTGAFHAVQTETIFVLFWTVATSG